MEESTLTKHYFISGRVQGVGFRAFCERKATQLKLAGWARNTNDGRVEVVVHGKPEWIAQFEQQLHQGPAHSQVKDVQQIDHPEVENFPTDHFEIRKDSI